MAKFEIKMPKLGESITEGTIITMNIKVGDTINEDDVLFEVNTAKVSAEIPSPVAGKILEVLFKEGDTVPVGTVVALVELEGEEGGSAEPAPAASQPAPAEAPKAAATSSSSPKFEIKMPKLGESITEGTIITLNIKVGDTINEDDVLFEVNTAKVSAEIPSPVAGKVVEVFFKEGDTVPVGTVVALVALEGEEGDSTDAPAASQPATATAPKAVAESPKAAKKDSEKWYSPVVLQLAKDGKVSTEELDAIKGSGFQGRVSKKDITLYIQEKKTGVRPTPATTRATAPASQPQAQAAPASASNVISAPPVKIGAEDQVIPMDPIRRIIADRMVMSKHVSPHVTTVMEVDVTKLAIWRAKNKDAFKKREGISLTYMPAIVEATAHALAQFPRINSAVDGYNIVERKNINVGVAVSLNDGNLIVPVIPNADQLNLNGLAHAVNSLAAKARGNKLSATEMQGGTFTITNYGSFGTLFSTPIINQPEVAILGVGAIEKKAVVIETAEGDTIAIRHKMYLSLSHDHRVVDGSLGGLFLKAVVDYLENWNA